MCKIVGEELVAKGVRRITALTGPKALQKTRENEAILKELQALTRTGLAEELPQRVTQLQEELKGLKKELHPLTI